MRKNKPVRPGQIRFTPTDNRLMATPPYINSNSSNLPFWVKVMDKSAGSMRRCSGTMDFLGSGVTLPMWTNVYFRPDGYGSWEMKADNFSPPADISSIAGFNYASTGECPMTSIRKVEKGIYPKIINPWRFETSPGWSSLILPAYLEPNDEYHVVPAIVNTDYYHLANIVLNITTDAAFNIKIGTPMYQIIPFERKSALGEIIFEDESNFKYVATTGFGMGHVSPSTGTSGPYRRERIRIDEEISKKTTNGIIRKTIIRLLGRK